MIEEERSSGIGGTAKDPIDCNVDRGLANTQLLGLDRHCCRKPCMEGKKILVSRVPKLSSVIRSIFQLIRNHEKSADRTIYTETTEQSVNISGS